MAAVDLRPAAGGAGVALSLDHLRVEGMRLRVGHRLPARHPARGTAVILTGRAEFIEKYEETVADLAAAGFAVAIFDWRGQGGSDRGSHNQNGRPWWTPRSSGASGVRRRTAAATITGDSRAPARPL